MLTFLLMPLEGSTSRGIENKTQKHKNSKNAGNQTSAHTSLSQQGAATGDKLTPQSPCLCAQTSFCCLDN